MTKDFAEHIRLTPALLAEHFQGLRDIVRLVLTTPEIHAIRRVVIFGSGDSLIVGAACKEFFETVTGLDVSAVSAMSVSRYLSEARSDDWLRSTLFIGISNSGEAARAVEATRRLRARSAKVLALTANPNSRLAQAASHVAVLPAVSLPRSPGYFSFMLMLLALQMLALRFGEVLMTITMDEAQAHRQTLQGDIAALETLQTELRPKIAELARRFSGQPVFELLGAGPSLAVAEFGAAKLMEAVGRHGVPVDLEEWAHIHYFVTDLSTPTILILPAGGAGTERASEILTYLETLGRPVIVVGGAIAGVTHPDLTLLPVVSAGAENLSPLLHVVPLTMLADELSTVLDVVHGRGFVGPWADGQQAASVQGSKISEGTV
ncbi:SIS domain-containing protein [Devosia sp. A449]